MRMMSALGGLALATSLFVIGGAAQADTLDFTIVSPNATSGFDILNGVAITNGSDVVTSLTGNVAGIGTDAAFSGAITNVLPPPSSPDGQYNYDGVMTATAPYFSQTQTSGIAFDFGSGLEGNIYFQPNDGKEYFSVYQAGGAGFNPGISENIMVAATPLPATLPMLASGLSGLFFLAFRKKKASQGSASMPAVA